LQPDQQVPETELHPTSSDRPVHLLLDVLLEAPVAVAAAARELAAGLRLTARVLYSGLKQRRFEQAGRRYVDRTVFDLRSYVSADTLTHNEAADVLRYQKVVEAEILRAVREFLREHNASTAPLSGQQMTQVFTNIVNNGVMGSVEATYLAVGEGSSNVTSPAQPPSEAA
jgi:hypothetical protein